jgi:nicotinamidase-related amidase
LWNLSKAVQHSPIVDHTVVPQDAEMDKDAVGGTSVIAHETGLRRMEQAGAKLTTVVQLACELQRDWNRHETVPFFVKALTEAGAFLEM